MPDISQLSDQELKQGYQQSQSGGTATDIASLSDADLKKQYAQSQGIQSYNDNSSSHFEKQMTKGMYDTVPFGKDAIRTFDPNDESNIQNTPEPQTWDEKLGRFVGGAVGFLPGFEAGAGAGKALAGPVVEGAGTMAKTAMASGNTANIAKASLLAKGAQGLESTSALAGGSVVAGAQTTGQDLSEGKSPQEALQEGASTAGTTMVGGKLIEGAGKAVGNAFANLPQGAQDVAGRIHDMIVRLPIKSFQYGKDPLDVMQQEGIVANSTTDYATQAKDRLQMRSDELNSAVADNTSTLDINSVVNHRIDGAISDANSSLTDRGDLVDKLNDMRQRISDQYGDLSKISLQDAVKLKRQIADDFPFSPMESASSTNNLMAKAGHQIYHDINSAVEGVAPKITELNQRVSSLIDISKAAQNRMAVESRNNPIGLIGTIIGGTVGSHMAGLVGGAEGAAAGLGTAVLAKFAASPMVMTRVAKTLSNMGEIEKINLYKAAPWFMDLAQQAHDFVANSSSGRAIGMQSNKENPVLFKNFQPPANNLNNTDIGSVGELFGQPAVVKRPVPFARTSQTEWPSVQEKPSVAGQDATDAMNTYNSDNPINRVAGMAAAGGVGAITAKNTFNQNSRVADSVLNPSSDDQQRLSLSPGNYTKNEEGKPLSKIQNDGEGTKSVGYGFNSGNPSVWKLVPQSVKNGGSMSPQQADAIYPKAFNAARNDAVQFAGNKTWNTLNPRQQQALTDMSYQMGLTRLNGFKDLKNALQNKDWSRATYEILNSKYGSEDSIDRARRSAILMNRKN